jgi:hypothetical protein
MPCTYTYLHSSAQRNSIYHAQTCPTTTHSCEPGMYSTHLSVWSVELWASAAAMCCAPSAPMAFDPRLYAHVCEKTDTTHVRSSRCAIAYIQPSARSCIRAYMHADIPHTNTRACLSRIPIFILVDNAIVHTPLKSTCYTTSTPIF